MIARFFRAFFWGLLVAVILAWLHLGLVQASAIEAILVEHITQVESKPGRLKNQRVKLTLIKPGELNFLPTRAFPGRIKLHPINVRNRIRHKINFKAGLRQSVVLRLDDTFFVKANFYLNPELDPDKLVHLFRKLGGRNWLSLRPFVAQKVNFILKRQFAQLYKRDADIGGLEEQLRTFILSAEFRDELNQLFKRDGIRFTGVVESAKVDVPDAQSYRTMIASARQILEGRRDRSIAIDRAIAKKDAEQIMDQAFFSRLEKIGVLLRKYPDLREYVAIDRLNKNVEVMVVPSDKWFGGSQSKYLNRLPGRKKSQIGPVQSPQPRVSRGRQFEDLTPP